MPKLIIDDTNWMNHLQPQAGFSMGYAARDYTLEPFGQVEFAKPFDLPRIPRSQWSRLIKDKIAAGTRLSDIRNRAKLKSQDQDGTNYCWFHAVVSAMRLIRALNNQPEIGLSAASGAARIKNFRNYGGWSGEAVEWVVANGVNSVEEWPENAISRTYNTPENQAKAKTRIITEWYELRPRDFEALATCLLNNIPVAIGLNWWRHAICAMDLVEISPGKFGVDIWNSWRDSYGENGVATLTESRATPDDAVAPIVVQPTTK